MKTEPRLRMWSFHSGLLVALSPLCGIARGDGKSAAPPPTMTTAMAQVPGWSPEDLSFFLHRSMGTEFVPAAVLLAPPAARAKTFHRGSQIFDTAQMGYTDAGHYVLDTSVAGSSNSGHDCGTDLSADNKRDLIEYLKTL